ncbi:type II secretion system protein [bacterium]|nr:type II secretion system protein [bacterium]
MKKIAFTLAETLIVMGIIGVVAALTLPNLNSSTANKEKVVKLQKIYSNLQDAFGRAIAVYGPTDEWCTGLTAEACRKRYFERVTEFMKFSKQCTVSDNCSLKFATGSSDGNTMIYGVILADGAAIDIYGYLYGSADIMIDIDGFNKGANKSCNDYFKLQYQPHNLKSEFYTSAYCSSRNKNFYGQSCAAWVLDFGNMDYLKADSSGKCPDGKTILDWTTNIACK